MRASRLCLVASLSLCGLVVLAVSGGGCSSDDKGTGGGGGSGGMPGSAGAGGGAPTILTLTIAPLGTSTATGTAVFQRGAGNQISLTVNVTGVAPVSAQHGIHIHANPDCGTSSDGDGGTVIGGAAGGHWNPAGHDHGPSTTTNHLGDIGNIMVDANGAGTLTFMTDQWTMGDGSTTDIMNHALILHAGTDDGVSQPTGNAGGRIGCVVIQ